MANNAIRWPQKAAKQLRKLDMPTQRVLRNAIVDLAGMPACQNVKALVKHAHGYRLRVGNYRVLFD